MEVRLHVISISMNWVRSNKLQTGNITCMKAWYPFKISSTIASPCDLLNNYLIRSTGLYLFSDNLIQWSREETILGTGPKQHRLFAYARRKRTYLVKIRDKESSIVNHKESTIDIQIRAVFPVHCATWSDSHLGDFNWFVKSKSWPC